MNEYAVTIYFWLRTTDTASPCSDTTAAGHHMYIIWWGAEPCTVLLALCSLCMNDSRQQQQLLTCQAGAQRQQGRKHRNLAEQRGPHPGQSSDDWRGTRRPTEGRAGGGREGGGGESVMIIPPSPGAQWGEDTQKGEINKEKNEESTKSSGDDAGSSSEHPEPPVGFAAGCLLSSADMQHGCTVITGWLSVVTSSELKQRHVQSVLWRQRAAPPPCCLQVLLKIRHPRLKNTQRHVVKSNSVCRVSSSMQQTACSAALMRHTSIHSPP